MKRTPAGRLTLDSYTALLAWLTDKMSTVDRTQTVRITHGQGIHILLIVDLKLDISKLLTHRPTVLDTCEENVASSNCRSV